jgi:3,4-dihydroxy 2-butanone 4-phosphate synthase/GTP cyclohydrolase II
VRSIRRKIAEDIVSPGHVFPLTARDGGVLVRAGHTEASVDISRQAGLNPSAVICEIMNDDGTMARLPELIAFAQFHNLKIGAIDDLIAYRRVQRALHREGCTSAVRHACRLRLQAPWCSATSLMALSMSRW